MASSTGRSVLLGMVALLALLAINAPLVNAGQSCGDGLACPDGFQCCVPGPRGCCQNINIKNVPSCTVCKQPSGRKLMEISFEGGSSKVSRPMASKESDP